MSLTNAQRRRIDRIAAGRSDESLYLLEGPKAILDALTRGVVAELWFRSDLDPERRTELEFEAREHDVPMGEGSVGDFDRLGRTVTPQGVIALVRDTALGLNEVLDRPGLLLWLDGVQDPGNVGAVIRVAAAFGAAGVVVTENTADPLGLKALRASAGLALGIPFTRVNSLEAAHALVNVRRPIWLLERGGDDVFEVADVPPDIVLVVGSESRGPGDAARDKAARSIGIPLAEGVDSLNAAVAAGIVVSQLTRGSAS